MLSYWFYPNPGGSSYDHPKILLLIGFCVVLLLASFAVGHWRRHHQNPVTKRLARRWPGLMRTFALVGFFLIVSRVEEIQFFAMRFLWLLWAIVAFGVLVFQIWVWRRRHYTIVPKVKSLDPRQEYLPK